MPPIDTHRFNKALESWTLANDRLADEASRLIERYCAELSYRWPNRVLELVSGNGSCSLEVHGKINSRKVSWVFDMDSSDVEGVQLLDTKRNTWLKCLSLPGVSPVPYIDGLDPSGNGHLLTGSAHIVTFRNGRKSTKR